MTQPSSDARGPRIHIELTQRATYPSSGTARRLRVRTSTGRSATAHVASWPLDQHRVQVIALDPPQPVEAWCAQHGPGEALNGAFFTKPEQEPLGELWIAGEQRLTRPFRDTWQARRGAVHVDEDGTVTIARRDELPATPRGSLLQAGPLLVADGEHCVADHDPEGFSTTFDEFDSDITGEALPRCVIALTDDSLLAVCVDGRAPDEDGLLFPELAALLLELGAVAALNLDGGSSSALVTDGVRRNVPRNDLGEVLEDGYPTPTAFVITSLSEPAL